VLERAIICMAMAVIFFLKKHKKYFSFLNNKYTFASIFGRNKFEIMFAIVTIAGQQFKVEEGQEIFVHQLAATEGEEISFNEVLLIADEGATRVGTPVIDSAAVKTTVLGHQKGDKVIIFKKKRRKGYVKKKGHRQRFTKIRIDAIVG